MFLFAVKRVYFCISTPTLNRSLFETIPGALAQARVLHFHVLALAWLRVVLYRQDERFPRQRLQPCPFSTKPAPRSLRRALLTPQVHSGPCYRCSKRFGFKEQAARYGGRPEISANRSPQAYSKHCEEEFVGWTKLSEQLEAEIAGYKRTDMARPATSF